MRLLLVDDEQLTREGIITAIDFGKLGITEIYQADDGANGLKVAKEIVPDIVLCDVRMPRMDGITMLDRIRSIQPDVVAVFMSGYSDKEYLKAAIQLKAVDYIEKPFEMEELSEILKKAVEQRNSIKLQSIADAVKETATAAQLAYRFTMPYQSNKEVVETLSQELFEHYGREKLNYVTTFIVKLREAAEDPDVVNDIYDALHGYLKPLHLHVIFTDKKISHIVYHIYGDLEPASSTLERVAEQLSALIRPLGDYYIAVGDTVFGKENIYKSYESAVILLQSSFFSRPNSCLTAEYVEGLKAVDTGEFIKLKDAYISAIDDVSSERARQTVEDMSELLTDSAMLKSQVRAHYYDMFIHLYDVRRRQGIVTDMSLENKEAIIDLMERCFSFEELHGILTDKTEGFFVDAKEQTEDDPTILMMREYVALNFSNIDLSVKSISDYVNLSVSYACTFFKNKTGTTLNQYITDFRMKKAKQLLSDPRSKVSEVSASVGYSDGNYFAKSFRKYTGISPTEYREQVIRT